MKILVIDDAPEILEVLQQMLALDGYDVVAESSGAKVLPLLDAQQPDLLLLDVWLPGYDGRDLCRQIKQQETLRHIPILLMSAHRDVQQIAAQTGADGSLQKPFQMSTLLTTIASALEHRLC